MTTQPLNILLADDDKDDRLFLGLALDFLTIPTRLSTVVDGEKLMDFVAVHFFSGFGHKNEAIIH